MPIAGSIVCLTGRAAVSSLNHLLRVFEPPNSKPRSMRLKHSTQACLSNHVWRVSSSPGCGLCCSIGDLQKRKALSQPRFARTSCKCTAASALVQDGWPLWAALSACAAGGQVLEQRTSFGAALSAPLLSLLLALLLSAAGILPTANPVYDMIWTYIMPLGAALYLLESDLRQ